MRDACGWEYCAAWLASMAVWLWLNRNAEWAGLRRLQRVLVRFGLRSADDSGGADGDGTCDDESDGHGRTVRNDGENRDASPRMPTIGAAACVAALRASVRSGATLVQAFEELQGAPFAVPELTRFRIDMAVRSRCSLQEQHKHVDQLGAELHAACTLSLQLGCEMSRCLEAVAASLKRRRLLDDLRAYAENVGKIVNGVCRFCHAAGHGEAADGIAVADGDARGMHGSPSLAIPCGRRERMDVPRLRRLLLCRRLVLDSQADAAGACAMSLAWPMLAAVGAAGATWLYEWSPARNPPDSDVRSCNLPLPLILEMLSVAIRQGASIPRALITVGNIVEGEFGGGLRSAGERLNSGMPWNEAWPDDDDCAVVRDAFSSSWSSGSSPVNRLATAIEQLDWDERSRIEQSAAKLSIRLLLPTGLCMLPAFVAIGVIPAVMSFL